MTSEHYGEEQERAVQQELDRLYKAGEKWRGAAMSDQTKLSAFDQSVLDAYAQSWLEADVLIRGTTAQSWALASSLINQGYVPNLDDIDEC